MTAVATMVNSVKPTTVAKSGIVVKLKSMAASTHRSRKAPTITSSTMFKASSDAGLRHSCAASAAATCRIGNHTTAVMSRLRIGAAAGPTNAGDSVDSAGGDGAATVMVRRFRRDAEGGGIRGGCGIRVVMQEARRKHHT